METINQAAATDPAEQSPSTGKGNQMVCAACSQWQGKKSKGIS